MFTDTVNYTSSTQSNEARSLESLRRQARLVRPLFAAHQGHEVKSTGDGYLVEFDSALKAIECAVEIQRLIFERNTQRTDPPFQIRIGIHLGDVVHRKGDILGDAVNIAARIERVAEPGGICVSGAVREQVWNKIPDRLEKLPPAMLKGLESPMEIYRVVLPWIGRDVAPVGAITNRLAVLPLSNISPDPKDEYFADGLTEELTGALSKIRELRVVARTSAGQYKATSKTISQIGAELGVASVLEGSVRKSGNRLRVTLQLINVGTEEHVWAENYDRELDDVFAIQTDIAERTAGALRLELIPSARDSIQRGPTSDLGAYDLYLRGLAAQRAFYSEFTRASEAELQRCFEGAIRKDPHFARAYSELANSLIAAAGVTASGTKYFPRARELVARALELDPHLPEAHVARGNVACQADKDWQRAEAEYREAIDGNPNLEQAHGWYGILLAILQRFPEAQREIEWFTELDPIAEAPRRWLFAIHHLAGESEQEYHHANAWLERSPASTWAHVSLALLAANRGDAAEAGRQLDLAHAATGFMAVVRTATFARIGRERETRAVLEKWESDFPTKYVPMTWLAALHSALGEREKALEWLERDFHRDERALWFDYQWEHYDPIRKDPRFESMLRTMGLPTTLKRPTLRTS
jgi:adenylate cyclase